MLGTTLQHYLVEARLGQGGMGTVYRARDTELDRTVAIKVLEVADGEARARLLHEARAASALNHPNIVTIHGVQQHGDVAFIVMEHVEGVPLDRAVPDGGLPPAQALALRHRDRRRAGRGARPGHRPPRHQAGQRDRHPGRPGEGARLRHRAPLGAARRGDPRRQPGQRR